jgi:hypothetical protein
MTFPYIYSWYVTESKLKSMPTDNKLLMCSTSYGTFLNDRQNKQNFQEREALDYSPTLLISLVRTPEGFQ